MTLYNTKEKPKGRKTNVSWPELSLKGRTYLFYACGTSKCDNLDRCSRNMIKIKIKICILKNYHVLVMLEIPIIYIVNGYLIGLVEPHKVSCSICFPNNFQWIKEIIKPLRRWIQSFLFNYETAAILLDFFSSKHARL